MRRAKKSTILFLLTVSVVVGNFCFFLFQVRPTIENYCGTEVRSVIRNVINAANEVILSKNVSYEDVFSVKKKEGSELCLVTANNGLINQISMLWATEIQKGLDSRKNVRIKRPAGAFSGSALFAQFGKDIELNVNFSATSRTEYKSSFSRGGINQTLHRLYLTAYVDATIITPFRTENVVVDETYLFAESVIDGKVPSTYISSSDCTEYLDLIDY